MSNKAKILVLAAVMLVLMVGFYFLYPKESAKSEISESERALYEKYINSDGLHLLEELLKEYPKIDTMQFIPDELDSTLSSKFTGKPAIYVLIDADINISPKAVDTLLQFVKNGNTALVAVSDFNAVLSNRFAYSSMVGKRFNDEVSVDFTHPNMSLYLPYLYSEYEDDVKNYRSWNYFNLSNFIGDINELAVLGTETYGDQPVFIKMKYGKGYFYFHSLPELFYNASLFNEDGLEYIQRVFSHLPQGHYYWHNHTNRWDEYSDGNSMNPDEIIKESPIQYILKDRSLRHAYLILVLGLIVYVLFKVKRRQQIIPTIEPNTNSSLEFVENVSLLYLKQEKHYKFIRHYQQSFLHFIKNKYYLTSAKIDAPFLDTVSQKSGIEIEKVEEIFKEFKRAKKSYNFTSEELIELHNKIEYFYKNCK